MTDRVRTLAEAVREACAQAAVRAFEDAGLQGLCVEGRLEAAIAAIRAVDIDALVRREPDAPVDDGRNR